MLDTKRHCIQLLDAVCQVGDDPTAAYQGRNRLRRALLALERGPREAPSGSASPAQEIPEVGVRARALAERVAHLCQPSEALDDRWRREWAGVREEIVAIQRLLSGARRLSSASMTGTGTSAS